MKNFKLVILLGEIASNKAEEIYDSISQNPQLLDSILPDGSIKIKSFNSEDERKAYIDGLCDMQGYNGFTTWKNPDEKLQTYVENL